MSAHALHLSFVCHAYLKYIIFSQVPSELLAGCHSRASPAASAFVGLLGGERLPL